MKRCSACGTQKPLMLFFRNRSSADGHGWQCKDCHGRGVRSSRRKHAPKVLAQKRKWNLAHSELVKAKARRYRAKHREEVRAYVARVKQERPERYAAKLAVRNAVRRGDLSRPSRCENCGERRRLNAHHPDYSKPLEVKFLCHRCHGDEHLRRAALEEGGQ